MKLIAIASLYVLASTFAAQATSAQSTPLNEETAILLTARSMKRCLAVYEDTRTTKTYTPEEVNNFCGCWSVTITNMTTQAEYDLWTKQATWPDAAKQKTEAEKYCYKYLNHPDAKELRKKKW